MLPRLSLYPTTTGRCWPGVLNLHSSKVSGVLKVRYTQNSGKKYFFKETCATMWSTRGFGFKNRNFGGFFPGKRSLKPFFDCGGQAWRIISVNIYQKIPYLLPVKLFWQTLITRGKMYDKYIVGNQQMPWLQNLLRNKNHTGVLAFIFFYPAAPGSSCQPAISLRRSHPARGSRLDKPRQSPEPA